MLWVPSEIDVRVPSDSMSYGKPLLNTHEARYFDLLEERCQGYCRIVPKPCPTGFLQHRVSDWKSTQQSRQKAVDFLLCRHADWLPMVAVELINSPADADLYPVRDLFVTSLLLVADLPLVRVEVSDIENADRWMRKLAEAWANRERSIKNHP